MKRIVLLCSAFFSLTIHARAQVRYDTVSHRPVGQGVWHTHIVAPSVPWNINVLTVDLKNPFIALESAKANDRLAGLERTSSMARRKSRPGHQVIGAINGDFYNTANGVPINIQVVNGEILRNPNDRFSTLGFTNSGRPALSRVRMNAQLIHRNRSWTINGVNTTRSTNHLILFNSYNGPSTGTNPYGSEVPVRSLGAWLVNDTLVCVVDTVVQSVGNMAIPRNKAVLSGHGASKAFLDTTVQRGDTLKLYIGLTATPSKLKELIGGYPRIVLNGTNYAHQGYQDEGGPSHAFQREPRTAAGFSADSSTLYLITVDGRNANLSVGMTLEELADFMVKIGVGHGVNLDGGGSTTMVVRDVIVNSPSDGRERSVANALLVVSSAPTDTLAIVRINPRSARVFRGESVQFTVGGYDKYFNPVPLDVARLKYRVDLGLGTIDSSGKFTAGMTSDTGYVYIEYGSARDSARVIVKDLARIVISPKSVVTDTRRTIAFRIDAFDIDNVKRLMPISTFSMRATDTTVGWINQDGVFKGRRSGATKIVASYGKISDTASVRVELGWGSVLLDSMETASSWTVTGQNIDLTQTKLVPTDEVKTLGRRSLRVDYTFAYDPTKLNFVYLNTDLPVFGVPDSIIIDARSDDASHRIFYYVEDDNGEAFRIYTNKFANRAGAFDTIRASLTPAVSIGPYGEFHFPIRIKKIEIQLGSSRQAGQVYRGSLYLDNLRVSFPAKVATSAATDVGPIPTKFRLFQNYPNPFNSTTVVSFYAGESQRVDLRLYDVLGREVMTVLSGKVSAGTHSVTVSADRLASGVYFLRSVGPSPQLIRIMLLK